MKLKEVMVGQQFKVGEYSYLRICDCMAYGKPINVLNLKHFYVLYFSPDQEVN